MKITLDIGHADRAEGIRPAFEEFAPYLRHVHVHDSDGVRDHQELGSAKVAFAGLSDLLQPFPHMLVIEVRGGEEPAATSLRNLNYLKQVVGWAAR